MDETLRAQLTRFVATWAKAGPALEEIRRQELADFDYAANAASIDALLQLATREPYCPSTSGLVEQQRLFQKLRP